VGKQETITSLQNFNRRIIWSRDYKVVLMGDGLMLVEYPVVGVMNRALVVAFCDDIIYSNVPMPVGELRGLRCR
jgi:hypothetical protein